MNRFICNRVYEAPLPGFCILVDRLWPRGIKKDAIDLWAKDSAPSNELRIWLHHNPELYAEFVNRYHAELESIPMAGAFLTLCSEKLKAGDVILLFAAKDKEHNNAVALKVWLEEMLEMPEIGRT